MSDQDRDLCSLGSSAGSTSPELLEASRRREPQAWEDLVVCYSPLVYSWARLAGLSSEDASDIVQDVFRSVYTSLPSFEVDSGRGSFRGWLRTITNNKVIDLYRKENRRVRATGGLDTQSHLSELAIPDDPLSDVDLVNSRKLWELLDGLRDNFTVSTWKAFWGMTVECRTSPELAEELNMTAAAVRLARIRVLRRLRQEIERRLEQ